MCRHKKPTPAEILYLSFIAMDKLSLSYVEVSLVLFPSCSFFLMFFRILQDKSEKQRGSPPAVEEILRSFAVS